MLLPETVTVWPPALPFSFFSRQHGPLLLQSRRSLLHLLTFNQAPSSDRPHVAAIGASWAARSALRRCCGDDDDVDYGVYGGGGGG